MPTEGFEGLCVCFSRGNSRDYCCGGYTKEFVEFVAYRSISGQRGWTTACKEDSFIALPAQPKLPDDPARKFYGCPPDCRYYRSVRVARVKRIFRSCWAGLIATVNRLDAQPVAVKILILAIILGAVLCKWGPNLLNHILEVAKIILPSGK